MKSSKKFLSFILSITLVICFNIHVNAIPSEITTPVTQENIHYDCIRKSLITALSTGSTIISSIGKVASYSSAGCILGQLFYPQKVRSFIIAGASTAVIEKLGKILYNYLNTHQASSESPLVNNTSSNQTISQHESTRASEV